MQEITELKSSRHDPESECDVCLETHIPWRNLLD